MMSVDSKEVFSDQQIDAVVVAIKSLLDASRTDALPQTLTHDKILATWNRAKDEVDSYKDGNRSLEENLSRLRRGKRCFDVRMVPAEHES